MRIGRKIAISFLVLLLCIVVVGCGNGTENGNTPVPPPPVETNEPETIDFASGIDEQKINWYGRTEYSVNTKSVYVNNTASGFEVKFNGTPLKVTFRSRTVQEGFMDMDPDNARTYLGVSVDGGEYKRISIARGQKVTMPVAAKLAEGEHTVTVRKSTEAQVCSLEVFELAADGKFLPPPVKPAVKLEFYGDSITAGMNAMKAEDKSGGKELRTSEQQDGLGTYAFYAAQQMQAQANMFCVSGQRLSHYGAGGDTIPSLAKYTSPAGGAEWDFERYRADAVIINLGTNDVIAYGAQANFRTTLKKEYKEFVEYLRARYGDVPVIVVYGVYKYRNVLEYNSLFAEAVTEMNTALGNVYGVELSPTASAHPTRAEASAYGEVLATRLTEILAV